MSAALSGEEQALLMQEGDRLAADLARRLAAATPEGASEERQSEGRDRLQFMGRTLAVNLVRVFMQTVEEVSRKAGKPLQTALVTDQLERPVIVVVNGDGEVRERIAVDDLLGRALYSRGELRSVVATHLWACVGASNENLATRALVACLKSRPVMDVTRPYLTRYLR
jgi:hypothetical protein